MRTRDLLHVAPHIARMTAAAVLDGVPGAGRPTTSRCASSRRIRGSGWRRSPRPCQHSATDAAARPQHRRVHAVPAEVTQAFVHEAARTGCDIFRIFDALNNVAQIRPAIEAVRETDHGVAEAAICYTGNLTGPAENLYTLDYYLRLAEQMVGAGAHILAIKDMAGLLRAPAAAKLVAALRAEFDLPVHLHTHDTAGGQLGTLLAAINAGVDAVDVASAA